MSQVALFTHPACLGHDPGEFHPESPARLRRVLQALEHPDFATLIREQAPLATVEQLRRVHGQAYITSILELHPAEGRLIELDPDTLAGPGSVDAALHAAGGAVAAVDAVMEGWARAAFAAVRPPGHHAEPNRAMGFCLFNNAAIAALHARARWSVRRIAVVDFDVHHGNGTQEVFAADPDLLYLSSHQSPSWPGTGHAREHGVARNIVNMEMPAGAKGLDFRMLWDIQGLSALDAFAPELLIISAGFDAHQADPLAQLRLNASDFAWLTDQLVAAAERHCRGRVVSILEGGYDLDALAACTAAHVRALMQI
ncbi:MAG TPA: histone deacetylase family protein [Acetobacteraceae bacterium]|nr:histone deacetylase family protein [Acetobacteraceae bacterium]